MEGKNMAKKVENRIEITDAKFVEDDSNHIAFAIAVDGVVVHRTLEWIDEDRDLVSKDSHLINSDSDLKKAVTKALNEDEIEVDEILEAVFGKLLEAVEELKEAA
jgi:hypothetical protein